MHLLPVPQAFPNRREFGGPWSPKIHPCCRCVSLACVGPGATGEPCRGADGHTGAAASHHFCPGQLLCKDHLCWNGAGMVQQVLPFLTRKLPLVFSQPEPGWGCQVPSFRAGKDLEATENGDRKNWPVEVQGASRSRAVPAQTDPSGQWGWSGGTGCRLAEPSPVGSHSRQRWNILGNTERNKGP